MQSQELMPFSGAKWLRASDGLIAGICLGLARRLGVDPWLVRLLWLLSVCVFGTGILLYLIIAFCLPRDDDPTQGQRRRILGVCWRISQQSELEVGLVRILAVFLSFASFGLTIFAYIGLKLLLPQAASGKPKQLATITLDRDLKP